MNLELTDVLIEGLFARKVIKTIKNNDYNEKLLEQIEEQMLDTLNGLKESSNYETSSKNLLKHFNAYGNAITIVQSSPELIQQEDCIETIAKEILKEIKIAKGSKTISPEILPRTLQWYEKIRKYSINQGSRFNIQPRTETTWGIITKF